MIHIIRISVLTVFLLVLNLSIVKAVALSVLSGFISIILLQKPFEKMNFKPDFIYYIVWLCKEIFLASLAMIKIILQPKRLNLTPLICTMKTQQHDDTGKTILGNSITLTPGTITISVDKRTIAVHSISKKHFKDLHKSPMDTLIKEFR